MGKISRIVKMSFQEEKVEDFLKLFEEKKSFIKNFEGCTHLQLLADKKQKNIIFTYSCWNSDEALEAYRSSDLFAETWASTKVLFSDKPSAVSYERLVDVEK